jgi:hypothetical protein
MSDPFHLPHEPSELSIGLLTLSLRSDCENKGVSPKNHAHRARVIRQQTALLAPRLTQHSKENSNESDS